MKFSFQDKYKPLTCLLVLLSLATAAKFYFPFVSPWFWEPEVWIEQRLLEPANQNGIWDPQFLSQNSQIAKMLDQFQKGSLCSDLKTLDNQRLTHAQITHTLKKSGYKCYKKPLTVDSNGSRSLFLKVNGIETPNSGEDGVAWQEVCVQPRQGCVVRLKMDGFPRSKRSGPHSTKAVLLDKNGDPSRYENEAFKITFQGVPVPKGPEARFGLSACPYYQSSHCKRWVNAIMAAAHPDLKEPMPTSGQAK